MLDEDNQEMIKAEGHEPEKDQEVGSWNFLLAIALISIVGFAAIVILQGNNGSNNRFIAPEQTGNELVISVSSLSNKAKFYVYNANNVKIYFFAVIGQDDEVHIAFDACDVCYEAKQGYSQNDLAMVCNNCGNQFLIDGIGTDNLKGGCWPSYLPATVANGEIHISISDVVSKKYLFE